MSAPTNAVLSELLAACEATLELAPRCENFQSECPALATWQCFDAAGDPMCRCDEHKCASTSGWAPEPYRLTWATIGPRLQSAVDAAKSLLLVAEKPSLA